MENCDLAEPENLSVLCAPLTHTQRLKLQNNRHLPIFYRALVYGSHVERFVFKGEGQCPIFITSCSRGEQFEKTVIFLLPQFNGVAFRDAYRVKKTILFQNVLGSCVLKDKRREEEIPGLDANLIEVYEWLEAMKKDTNPTNYSETIVDQLVAVRFQEPVDQPGKERFLVLKCHSTEMASILNQGFQSAMGTAFETTKAVEKQLSKRFIEMHENKSKKNFNSEQFAYLNQLYKGNFSIEDMAVLSTGLLVEVMFDESYDVVVVRTTGDGGQFVLKKNSPVFSEGMYLRATVDYYDLASESYTLKYTDGPYINTESPTSDSKFRAEDTVTLRNVKRIFITYETDTHSNVYPYVIIILTFVQVAFFVVYCIFDAEDVSAHYPVAGPDSFTLRAISKFPGCEDMRYQVWRFFTYQLVHAGYTHILYNATMQLFFGIPVNIAHGQLRFCVLYESGVVWGALMCLWVTGEHMSQLVGCSGGVYSIFGMHYAELLLNWDELQNGFFNRWTRLLILISCFMVDIIIFLTSTTTSYSSYAAHLGGLLAGFTLGCVVLKNKTVSGFERDLLIPGMFIFVLGLTLLMVTWFSMHFPPRNLGVMAAVHDDYTCCYQLLSCNGLDSSDFDIFSCSGNVHVEYSSYGRLNSCKEFNHYADLNES